MSKELTPKTGQFDEIISIIDNARTRALKAVNAELIQMYWNVGEYLSSLCADSGFGDKVIDEVAAYIAEANPGVKGFNRRGLYRMKQFYETYKDDEFVTPLVTQISWTNHLLIMSGSKSAEERHFYMSLCAKEHYSKRELERQMDSAYYERYMLSSKKLIPESVPQDVRGSILDTYVLEFLDLPEQYSERNLRKAITGNLKQFILEFGKDFTFIGEEYRVQVGGQDFYIDLLFYNRALSCLVPIELKIGKFKPEHIGQINFYLEALDRDVKKPNENPSVGVILCAGKDDAVVEYALSRSMSPTLVSDYMKAYGVAPQAWGPLAEGKHGVFTDPELTEIGKKYGKSAAQVVLRWNVQRGVSIIPKSVHVERMEQNMDIWDFALTDEEMAKIATKDLGHSEIVDHGDPGFVKMLCGMNIHE